MYVYNESIMMKNLLNYTIDEAVNLSEVFSQSQPVPSILLENFLKDDFYEDNILLLL